MSAGSPMVVRVTREAYSDFYCLELPNGHTEELEIDEARQWFKDHGADMDVVEKGLDYVYNFRQAEIEIQNFRVPRSLLHPHAPKLD